MPEPGAGRAVVCLKGRQREFGPSLELAPHVLYVGRAIYMGGWRLPKSAWANPFTVRRSGSAEHAVELYAQWLDEQPELIARLPELSGLVLACWCPESAACHAKWLATRVDRLAAPRVQPPAKVRPLPDWALR